MKEFDEFKKVIELLRGENGCPWDREQTHSSLKPGCIEEAAELVCGINIFEDTGNAENMQEELGDLLLHIMLQAQIAEEEGLFTIEDVCRGIKEKMIRRHPHVFGTVSADTSEEVLKNWAEIKKEEKTGKEWTETYLPAAFEESKELIDRAMLRKGFAVMPERSADETVTEPADWENITDEDLAYAEECYICGERLFVVLSNSNGEERCYFKAPDVPAWTEYDMLDFWDKLDWQPERFEETTADKLLETAAAWETEMIDSDAETAGTTNE